MSTPLEVQSAIGRLRDHATKVRDVWPHTSALLDEAADMLDESARAHAAGDEQGLAPLAAE
jgi:hypothetical protein